MIFTAVKRFDAVRMWRLRLHSGAVRPRLRFRAHMPVAPKENVTDGIAERPSR